MDNKKHFWKTDQIASDFELMDIWDFPILADSSKGHSLKTVCEESVFKKRDDPDFLSKASDLLFRFRGILGDIFGWDKNINSLSIPGCTEKSISERLKPEDTNSDDVKYKFGEIRYVKFNLIFELENERLFELSNDTVHALMQYRWIHKYSTSYGVQLAIYVKPRGFNGTFYLNLIKPFRRLTVYPTIIKNAKKNWDDYVRIKSEC